MRLKAKTESAFCVKTTVMEYSYSGFSSSPSVLPLMVEVFLVHGFEAQYLKLSFPLPENRKVILLPLGEEVGSEKNYISMKY